MSLAWTLASILAGYLLLKMGYRSLALIGMILVVTGAFFMSRIGAHTSYLLITVYLSLMGLGMGLSIPAFLIAVQSNVRKKDLGAATSTLQFSRSIGGTLGVSTLGFFLSSKFASRLIDSGIDPAVVSLDSLLDSATQVSTSLAGPVRDALAVAIANLFLFAFIVATLGLVVVMFTPAGKVAQLEKNRAGD
jgi:MFS family permease